MKLTLNYFTPKFSRLNPETYPLEAIDLNEEKRRRDRQNTPKVSIMAKLNDSADVSPQTSVSIRDVEVEEDLNSEIRTVNSLSHKELIDLVIAYQETSTVKLLENVTKTKTR